MSDSEDCFIIKKKVKKTVSKKISKKINEEEDIKIGKKVEKKVEKKKTELEKMEKIQGNNEKNYDDLMIGNNGVISYILKKYKHRSIISIYEAKYDEKYENKEPEKGRLIVVKWVKNFYGENGMYLIELKEDEKYRFLFIGGTLIYEFNLLDQDSFVHFKCIKGLHTQNTQNTHPILQGKNNTYFLSQLKVIENDTIEHTQNNLSNTLYKQHLQDHLKGSLKPKEFPFNPRI